MTTTVVNTSTGPYTHDNPRGLVVTEGAVISLAFVLIVVGLRIWGRYRYKSSSGRGSSPEFGEPRFWVMMSDLAIIVSLLLAITLTVIACVGVHWGFGIHTKSLSATQTITTLEMFYLYQIFYKFASGISKTATCFLLLAISTPSMKWFNRTCKAMVVYIIGYCFACSLATVFQCQLDFKSNWMHTLSQEHCFAKPPFWYTHAGLNIFSSIIIAGLPWWLFHHISYKRKVFIATIMTILSVAELVFGCVRLRGLYLSAHSMSDLTYGATTGVLVSQLEVNFGIISACIPTALKIMEDFLGRLFGFGSSAGKYASNSDAQTQVMAGGAIHNTTIKPHSQYARFGDDVEMDSISSGNSRENIIRDGDLMGQKIKVETSYIVESEVGINPPPKAMQTSRF